MFFLCKKQNKECPWDTQKKVIFNKCYSKNINLLSASLIPLKIFVFSKWQSLFIFEDDFKCL